MADTSTIYTNFADDIADVLNRALQHKVVIVLHEGFGFDDYQRLRDAMSNKHPHVGLVCFQSIYK